MPVFAHMGSQVFYQWRDMNFFMPEHIGIYEFTELLVNELGV